MAGTEKKKVASVISFHALGWLAGITAAGITNDTSLIFLVSIRSFPSWFRNNFKITRFKIRERAAPGTTKKIISRNRFLFLSLLLRHIGAASVWTILPLMIVEELGGEMYHVSVVYVSNTVAAFVIMTLMATRIHMNNVTKFKIGIGMTTFVFIGLSFVSEWWQAMPFMALVGGTWAFLYIGVKFPPNGA